MPNYRRDYSGPCWFFTVVTHCRRPLLIDSDARTAIFDAIRSCRERIPFETLAGVLLPDHLHCIWQMSETDWNYSRRWSLIKRLFTQQMRNHGAEAPFWQARFWAHRIDDPIDYANHVAYVHFNPVKHGLVARVVDWPWSTFHRYVRAGLLLPEWGGHGDLPASVGRE
jgi:REP-associated tyrosine transposase